MDDIAYTWISNDDDHIEDIEYIWINDDDYIDDIDDLTILITGQRLPLTGFTPTPCLSKLATDTREVERPRRV